MSSTSTIRPTLARRLSDTWQAAPTSDTQLNAKETQLFYVRAANTNAAARTFVVTDGTGRTVVNATLSATNGAYAEYFSEGISLTNGINVVANAVGVSYAIDAYSKVNSQDLSV